MSFEKEIRSGLRILKTQKQEDIFEKFQQGKLSKEKLLEYIAKDVSKTLQSQLRK